MTQEPQEVDFDDIFKEAEKVIKDKENDDSAKRARLADQEREGEGRENDGTNKSRTIYAKKERPDVVTEASDPEPGDENPDPVEALKLNNSISDEVAVGNSKLVSKESPTKVTDETTKIMIRQEEIAAELVRTQGRFIEGVDNAKPGTTFTGAQANSFNNGMSPVEFMAQQSQAKQQSQDTTGITVRSDGITFDGYLDTGAGAQQKTEVEEIINDPNDPQSDSFITCVNKSCQYRDNCLRYRLSNKRSNKGVFFPETCRIEGIYLPVDDYNNDPDTPSIALTPLGTLESTSTPNF